jgi:hypothetical protein
MRLSEERDGKNCKEDLKSGLNSYTAEIRFMGFPHTNRSFRIRKEALTWARRTEPRRIQGFPLI